MRPIYPVLLSGGSGSRLWPLSRESHPKQFLNLTGARSLLQQAALRASDRTRFQPLIVVANADHRFLIAEQLREAGFDDARIVLEPLARNTAPAVAVAALLASRDDPDALILVMPGDHVILDEAAFHAAVDAGAPAAEAGSLVLFGVTPDAPATGYGYILAGETLAPGGPVRRVDAFVEKPDRATAETYLLSPDYLWNSGIFLLPVRTLLADLSVHAPEVLAAATQALDGAATDLDFVRLDPAAFAAAPSISIDNAVMELTDRAAVTPVTFPWTDVGCWSALWEISERDDAGNALHGDVFAEQSSGCYLRSEGPLVATVGVEDLIVVATPDAVLVAHKSADQDVKRIVDRLKRANRAAATQARRVHRPWGWYEGVDAGDRFQVKRISVKAGGKLSLQKHFHRAEHWIVVAGTAEVEVDGQQRLLAENESVYIPLGAVHRLSNPGKVPLHLVEVQSGPYLGEDDIVRFEDVYARA